MKPAFFRRRPKTFLVLIIALVFLAAALAAPQVLARAGGGERFPGPSSPSGGGHGGGGDDGALFIIMWLLFNPAIPLPVKIIVIVAILVAGGYLGKKKRASRGGTMAASENWGAPSPYVTPPTASPAAGALAAQLADLKARDPNFSEQSFEDMASAAFFKIQEAWAGRDMSIARAHASPSLLQRFEAQIRELKGMGRTNKVEQATIGALDIVEAFHDGGYDYVTVKIDAAAADYTVEDSSGQVVAGSREVRHFVEYWTFLRSDQVKTPEGKQEVDSAHCPNCGAPVSINAVGKCEYCGSDVTSGKFSWVLSEITQASVWRPRASAVPRPPRISPLAGERYVLGLVQCPNCGANVQDVYGITTERCWRCGGTVPTAQ